MSALLLSWGILAAWLIYPLWVVLRQAFIVDGAVSGVFLRAAVTTPTVLGAAVASVNTAIIVTLISLAIGFATALFLARRGFPGVGVIEVALLLPLILPPFVGALGVKALFGRFGTLNILLTDLGVVGFPIPFFPAGSSRGVIFLQVIHAVPLVLLYARAALQSVPQSLIDAAQTSGATWRQSLRHVVLPLCWPALASAGAIIFVGSMTDIGTPLLFEYRECLAVFLFNLLNESQENPVGYALIVLLTIFCAAVFFLVKLHGERLPVESSARAGGAPARVPARSVLDWFGVGGVVAIAVVGALPHLALLLTALSDRWIMSALPTSWTLHHFVEVFRHPLTARSLITSVGLSLVSTIVITLLGFAIAYLQVRSRLPTTRWLEGVALVPLAVPGIVFAFGYLAAFSGTPLDPRRNPLPLLLAAYTIRRLPPMVRSAMNGLQSANRQLEEAALVCGATPRQVLWHVVAPLMARYLLASALIAFAFNILEVSDSLLLALEERFYPVSKAIYALVGRPDGVELAAALGIVVSCCLGAAFAAAFRVLPKVGGRIVL
jgi:iron(III) transport system permease protein